ncbi:RnfABCDGE type electron transport complex subunit D [Alicyclobacillus fodiniaquatilis]|uniref:RnfABCDGE type electron transport complex subunit D n=1 Tax=Alicyclobacillus fodiniaquatilis TaxID=1661150 RepID=A0ABW4JJU2_9BACL
MTNPRQKANGASHDPLQNATSSQNSGRKLPNKRGPVMRFLTTPKGYVFCALLLLMFVASIHKTDAHGIVNVGIAVVTALLIDLLVALIQGYKRYFSDGGLVTGLIVGLILDSAAAWPMITLVTGIAVLSKHFLKVGRKPILNPAAFGLLVAVYIFHIGESWWGDLADLSGWFALLLLACGYIIVSRINKFPLVFSFLAVYFGLLLTAALLHIGNAAYSPGDALRDPIVNSALFMAFFMLTDPPTSPAKYGHQVVFGALTAVVSTAIYIAFGGLTYLLVGLLVANVAKALFIRSGDAKKRAKSSLGNSRNRVATSRN